MLRLVRHTDPIIDSVGLLSSVNPMIYSIISSRSASLFESSAPLPQLVLPPSLWHHQTDLYMFTIGC